MGPYTVTVIPRLIAEGEHKSHLEYLQFVANGQTGTKRWTTVSTGTLDNDFRNLYGDWGPNILDRLRKCETIQLPRTFELDEIFMKIAGVGND